MQIKTHLMFRNKDFIPGEVSLCRGKEYLSADLGTDRILAAMACGDDCIRASCTAALFSPLQTEGEIRYRQDILKDSFMCPEIMKTLYMLSQEALDEARKSWYWLDSRFLSGTFSSAVGLLNLHVKKLMLVRSAADRFKSKVKSEGLQAFFTSLQENLDDSYFRELNDCLDELANRDGILIGASAGSNLQGTSYVYLRKNRKSFRRRWALAPSYTLPERDERGAADLSNRTDRALNEPVNALAQSAENLKLFFTTLRDESAFYIGCRNLAGGLTGTGMKITIPETARNGTSACTVHGMYDAGLVLARRSAAVPNDFAVSGKKLCIITGANQGGKSTFLRSIGQAQLMAQCGMFIAASDAVIPVRTGIFTHFTREEDSALDSGKLDEELARMNEIVPHLQEGSLVLFNESFAATNEREGSEISRQIVRALTEHDISVVFVTHQYDFASSLYNMKSDEMIFLRAQREPDGSRTFKIIEGEPQHTSYGTDIYNSIFGTE
jgi:hypothetical protein